MVLDASAHSLLHEAVHKLRTDDLLAELLLLEKLQVLDGGTWVRQVLQVGRAGPVLEVGQVVDKSWLREKLARGKVVEVLWVGERLDKL